MVIYNAGMDPFERCEVGGLRGITIDVLRQREQLVFDWARHRSVPVAFVLAGGYTGSALSRDGLVDLHLLTLDAAVGSGSTVDGEADAGPLETFEGRELGA